MKTTIFQQTPRTFICGFNSAGYSFTGLVTAPRKTVSYSVQVREIAVTNNAKVTIKN